MEKRVNSEQINPLSRRYRLVLAVVMLMVYPGMLMAAEENLETTLAVQESVPTERWFDGTVEAIHQATISSQTAGRITHVYHDIDDYVEAGADLVRFSDVEQRTAFEAAQAAGNETQARLLEATADYQRAEDLYQRKLGSKRDLDAALAARDAARARAAAAQSAIESARQQLDYTLVKAPYPGIVTARYVEVGESVTTGQPLMSGLSLDRLRVVVDLPQQVTTLVRSEPVAFVATAEGHITPEKITVYPIADPVTNTFRVRIDLPEGQFGLYPGMFVKTVFVTGQKERLLIPSSALLRRSEVTAVYVVGEQDTRLRQVRIGTTFGDRVEVLAGLSRDERVALDPVRAGIHVKTSAVRK
jgi:RND family efflux transporter MFP subunit